MVSVYPVPNLFFSCIAVPWATIYPALMIAISSQMLLSSSMS